MRSRFSWAFGLMLTTTACIDGLNCSCDGFSGGVIPTPAASEVDVINCITNRSIAVYRIKGPEPAEKIGTLATSWDSVNHRCSPGANSALPVELGTGQYEIRVLLFPALNSTSECNALKFDTQNCESRSYFVTGQPSAGPREKRFR